MNSKAVFHLLFHGSVAFIYLCALIRFQSVPPILRRPHELFAGHWKFLTVWNLVTHLLFFALLFFMDFMKLSSSSKLMRFRDAIYAGIVFPFGVFVVVTFWSLHTINRELIFPKVLDETFPFWLNHVGHSIMLPVMIVETYIVHHRYPRRKDGMKLTMAYGLAYGVWVLILGLMDIWAYPILRIISWPQRAVFMIGSLVLMPLLYLIGEKLNYCFWGDDYIQKKK